MTQRLNYCSLGLFRVDSVKLTSLLVAVNPMVPLDPAVGSVATERAEEIEAVAVFLLKLTNFALNARGVMNLRVFTIYHMRK